MLTIKRNMVATGAIFKIKSKNGHTEALFCHSRFKNERSVIRKNWSRKALRFLLEEIPMPGISATAAGDIQSRRLDNEYPFDSRRQCRRVRIGHELLSFLFRYAHKNLSTLDPDSLASKTRHSSVFRSPGGTEAAQSLIPTI